MDTTTLKKKQTWFKLDDGEYYRKIQCPICMEIRWGRGYVIKRGGRCRKCFLKLSHKERTQNWKGGRFISGGYVFLFLDSNDFFFPMADKRGYVREHRLLMAKSLGRCLQSWENVHHRNGIRIDNRLENLELTTNSEHLLLHQKGYKDGYIRGLKDGRDKQIQELRNQIKELAEEIILLKQGMNEGRTEQWQILQPSLN